jgi:uncharacterized membrane protein
MPMNTSTPASKPGLLARLRRLLVHRWHDDRLSASVPPALVQQLTAQVAQSEQRHTGEIRICIEGGLPSSYLWRGATARERAITQFGKLRVWDTEHNNGVLIYVLLAEHAIEIVADRGLARAVPAHVWGDMVNTMQAAFRQKDYAQGLHDALEKVTAVLTQHFPASAASRNAQGNQLPDLPVIGRA